MHFSLFPQSSFVANLQVLEFKFFARGLAVRGKAGGGAGGLERRRTKVAGEWPRRVGRLLSLLCCTDFSLFKYYDSMDKRGMLRGPQAPNAKGTR